MCQGCAQDVWSRLERRCRHRPLEALHTHPRAGSGVGAICWGEVGAIVIVGAILTVRAIFIIGALFIVGAIGFVGATGDVVGIEVAGAVAAGERKDVWRPV